MKFLNEIDGADKLKQDSNNRLVTDAEKTAWNGKQDALGYTPVNKAGDTMTGPLALTGSIFDTEFKADNWNLINKLTGGGWARGLLNVKNKDGTDYIQIGGLGSGQNFTRLYIGKAWNDWLLGVNPNNNTVEIQGNLTKNNKEVATEDEIPTKLSELTKDIDFDERYYTESEIDARLSNKVDKIAGKGLSSNDYTTAEKNKLAGIEAGANNYSHPNSHPASMITESTSRRFVSDAEKASWNNKAEISDIPTKVSQLTNDSGFLTTNDLVPNISIGKSKPTDDSLIWYEEI